jgi:hypothetical protein
MNRPSSARLSLHIALAVLWALAPLTQLFATQTAFWRPYQADEATHLLMHFDEPDFAKAEGEGGQAELVGDAARAAEGRFGGALRLSGAGAVKVAPKAVFRGGAVSIEAWLKLDRYPEKEAFVVCRPAVVDQDPRYEPERDRTKGFSLLIDSKGALHLETVNLFYGKRVRTSSEPGAVPVGQWVHVAGISAGYRRLYVNGREVASAAILWGEGLAVHGDEEREPGPLYIGNDPGGKAGLSGLVDEVRVHRNIFKLWEREDMAWARRNDAREIPASAPWFVPGHEPVLHLPLDGDTTPQGSIADLKVAADKPVFAEGVRRQGLCSTLNLSAPRLLDLNEGSLEFWFQPYGVNTWSDRNRGFVSVGWGFTLYIFNGGGPGRPLSLYFANRRGELVFLNDESEYYEGRWRHAVITWRERTVSLYMDGKLRGRDSSSGLALPQNKGVSTSVAFNPGAVHSVIDEVHLYRKALLPEEVANAFYRYREPERMRKDLRLDPIEIEGMYLPSVRTIYYRLIPNVGPEAIRDVTLTLSAQGGGELLRKTVPFTRDEAKLEVPELKDGLYSLAASVTHKDGKTEKGGSFIFQRRRFSWQGNKLGLTEAVYPPFTPVQVRDDEVSVVLRRYKVNGFGLCDSIVAAGRELLAAPMTLRYWANGAEGKWERSIRVRALEPSTPDLACLYHVAYARELTVETRSFIATDGCMRVVMTLLPTPADAKIDRLSLEIPLRASEARLLHETTDTLRQNFAGALPPGEGVVWDSRKGRRSRSWLNAFTAYIWLGNPNRGLAWFAENDKRWGTRKDMTLPLQEIVREGDRVVLRIHLVNEPTTIVRDPVAALVFGLQASPTKPMPPGWRAKLPSLPTGLAVVPWGGLNCSYQGPYRNDWRIVDKILEARSGGKIDTAWFQQYAKEHNPPPAHGTWPWLDSVLHFAGRARDVGPNKPLTVYHEEMAACTVRDEWKIFADEWTTAPESFHRGPRTEPDESIFRSGKDTNPSAGVNFCRSYQDFGCHFANEWLQRGVSLYWDNTYPRASLNPRTSAAYVAETGDIQPAVLLWDQREYQMRVWNLLQEWRGKRPEPLEWVNHMTNTLVLPIHTWATANLDHELGSDKPFSPEWLQAETVGRQVGNYPLTLYPITGTTNKVFEKTRPPEGGTTNDLRYRAEWGMRMVHEIQTNGGKLYEIVRDFGYETDAVAVHNYWADEPVLSVEPPQVKWLVLAKPQSRELLIILASWAADDVKASIRFNLERLRFLAGRPTLTDAEDGSAASPDAIPLPGPYGVRILKARLFPAPGP